MKKIIPMQNDFDLSEKCRMFAFDSDQESFSVIESAAFFYAVM